VAALHAGEALRNSALSSVAAAERQTLAIRVLEEPWVRRRLVEGADRLLRGNGGPKAQGELRDQPVLWRLFSFSNRCLFFAEQSRGDDGETEQDRVRNRCQFSVCELVPPLVGATVVESAVSQLNYGF